MNRSADRSKLQSLRFFPFILLVVHMHSLKILIIECRVKVVGLILCSYWYSVNAKKTTVKSFDFLGTQFRSSTMMSILVVTRVCGFLNKIEGLI